jgi:hypothetical protein
LIPTTGGFIISISKGRSDMKTIKPRRKSGPERAAKTEAVCQTKTKPARSPVEIDPLLLAALDETRAAMKKTEAPPDSLSLLEA